MLLMIDNYDSFTYNLVQYLGELGADVRVFRNDQVTVEQIEAMAPEKIVISPGPCTPNEAGVSIETIKAFAGKVPHTGRVPRAPEYRPGVRWPYRSCAFHHARQDLHDPSQQRGVFHGLPDPFEATRYHSLVIEKDSLPDCLEVTAWTEDSTVGLDEIMGVRHRSLPVEGVQFHPESILTGCGHDLLRNFLNQ